MSLADLTFFTSNQTKLAHARYLGRHRGFRILGFRERTYYAGYDEPRTDDRKVLLESSFTSALDQANRAKILHDDTVFFLEDTSVKIDVLSSKGEYPGTEVKYWMRSTSFEELDSLLKANGNNRACHVRSDIVMRLPKALQDQLKTEKRHIVFTGVQKGSVAIAEQIYETHLFYPWLDNQTFNKWFVPSGESQVLGSLPIEIADKYDFRANAMDKMFTYLETTPYGPIKKKIQGHLPLESVVSLSGYTCAGKTTGAQIVQDDYGYLHVEASDFMHLAYAERHGENTAIRIGDFAEVALKHEPNVVARQVAEYLDSLGWPENIIISGFRDLEEIEYLKFHKSGRFSGLSSIFVDASGDLRFSRMKARMRPGDTISKAEFERRDSQQQRMGLDEIRKVSESISNEKTLKQYRAKLATHVSQRQPNLKAAVFGEYLHVTDLDLEPCIILALQSLPQKDETGEYYTTTAIARLIKTVFPNLIRAKHKNNISRYFNQYNRPYYDRKIDHDGKKKSYRLSNTGFGYAVYLMRELQEAKRI